ncbi:MAG: hypothetical protein HY875_07710 [Chloroflexi bacterium]|nr:hypothetical protein [Chloroflexota bacterium]
MSAEAHPGTAGHEHGHEMPPKPDSGVREGLIPEMPMLWRGLAFAGGALLALRMARWAVRGSLLIGKPVALGFLGAAVLSAWASAIHLTGGEKFDDHDCV